MTIEVESKADKINRSILHLNEMIGVEENSLVIDASKYYVTATLKAKKFSGYFIHSLNNLLKLEDFRHGVTDWELELFDRKKSIDVKLIIM
jgi:hypothetical protein